MEDVESLRHAKEHWQSVTNSLLCQVPAGTRGRHLKALCDEAGRAVPLHEREIGVAMYHILQQTPQEVSGSWLLHKAEAELWKQRGREAWQYVPTSVARAYSPNPFQALVNGALQQPVQIVEWDAEALCDTGEQHFAPFAKLEAYIGQCLTESTCPLAVPLTFDKATANQNGFYICLPPSTNKFKIRIKSISGGKDFHCSTALGFWQAVLQAARAFYCERQLMPYVPLPHDVQFVQAT